MYEPLEPKLGERREREGKVYPRHSCFVRLRRTPCLSLPSSHTSFKYSAVRVASKGQQGMPLLSHPLDISHLYITLLTSLWL